MSEEQNNALSIARFQGALDGELKAVRAEMEGTKSKIDESLSLLRADMAKRDLWIILTIIGVFVAGFTVLGILISLPG